MGRLETYGSTVCRRGVALCCARTTRCTGGARHHPYPSRGAGAWCRTRPGYALGPYTVLGAGCRLAAGAVVRESVLWEGVQVGAGAQVRGCVLATGVQVPAASTLVQVVLRL